MKNIYSEDTRIKSRKGLIILNIILLLSVIGLVLFILYDKKIIFSEKTEKRKNPESKLNTDTLKIYNDYEIVYDASYTLDEIEKEYIDTKNNYRYLIDIVVPFVNINSESVTKVNDEIKDLYDSLIEEYKNNLVSTDSYVKSNYTYIIYNDIVSVLIKITRNENNKEIHEYKTYNIDLNDKSLLTYSNLYKKITIKEYNKKITKNNVELLEKEAIKLKTEELLKQNNIETKEEYIEETEDEKTKEIKKQTLTKEIEFAGLTANEWIESCTNEYLLSKKEETNNYFINKEGNLNIIVKVFNGEKEYSCNETSILELNGNIYKSANIK